MNYIQSRLEDAAETAVNAAQSYNENHIKAFGQLAEAVELIAAMGQQAQDHMLELHEWMKRLEASRTAQETHECQDEDLVTFMQLEAVLRRAIELFPEWAGNGDAVLRAALVVAERVRRDMQAGDVT